MRQYFVIPSELYLISCLEGSFFMLHLFLKDSNIELDKEIVTDVEKEFSKLYVKMGTD